jgi:hypothetical protein
VLGIQRNIMHRLGSSRSLRSFSPADPLAVRWEGSNPNARE